MQDTGFRVLSGARVEVVQGPHAGASATTDHRGQFSLTGAFDDSTTFRASKNGHVSTTRALHPVCASCDPNIRGVRFYLEVLAPPARIAGDYTLTFTADTTCAALPNEVRTRSFPATISTVSLPEHPANTLFRVNLTGASFFKELNGFDIAVAGNYLHMMFTDHDFPYVVEQVAPNTYITFAGSAETVVGTGMSTISTRFAGAIEFCELTGEMDTSLRCNPGMAVA